MADIYDTERHLLVFYMTILSHSTIFPGLSVNIFPNSKIIRDLSISEIYICPNIWPIRTHHKTLANKCRFFIIF